MRSVHCLAFLAILFILQTATAGDPPAAVLTQSPFTYILDYGADHVRSPAYIERISQAPPTLLHLGKDVPFTHNWGPIQALGGENQAYGKRKPYAPEDYIRRLSPAETQRRVADLTKLVEDLHQAGVKWVTPYICSMTIGGHPERRAGFWEFFDRWDEYQAFALGPRPASDPFQWIQVRPDGKPHFFYTFTGEFYPGYEPNIRYAVCQNRPEWRYWTEKVVENVARCGVDGVFVDNAGSLRCHCPVCQQKWRAWLGQRYTADQRQRLFGVPDPALGDSKQPGLLWAETQRFRCACLKEHLQAIADAGTRITGKPFVVFPNGGEKRPENILHIYPDTDLIMFERSVGPDGTNPGMALRPIVEDVSVKKYNDNIFEYKFVQCLRRKVRPILLTRPGWQVPIAERKLLEMNLASAALGNAEAAAFGGGGGFLQRADPELMQVQQEYRTFFERQPELYERLDSFAEVAVVVLPDLAWLDGGVQHQTEVRKVTASLLDSHVLFDYLIAGQVTTDNLAKYAAVVLPRVSHLAGDQAAALKQYVHAGGVLVVTGASPQFDQHGQRPAQLPLADLLAAQDPATPLAVRRVGKGAAGQAATFCPHWIEKTAGRSFSVIANPPNAALAKVRVNAFRRPGQSRYVVHLINYNVPLGVQAGEPELQQGIAVAARLPGITAAPRVRCYDPQGQAAELPAEVRNGQVQFTLPELRIYKVLEIVGAQP
ncbi:MAG: hypothetical protein GX575_22045 [Candidatus Anammoximicrobium sp.]|nr:hypothetical protein [Candidatus Anammoximicrobium sp.]